MKKVTKILLSLVLTFICAINVNAAYKVGDAFTISNTEDYNTGIKCYGCYAYVKDGKTYQENNAKIHKYVLPEASNSPVYCMDAHLDAVSSVKVTDVITSDTSDSKYYIGLSAIGANGYSNAHTSNGTISGTEFYSATNLAIRMYALAMGHGYNFDKGSISGSRYTYQLAKTAASIMNKNRKISNDAIGANCDSLSCFETKVKLSNITNLGAATTANKVKDNVLSGGNIMEVAEDLFLIGLEAAANNSVGSASAKVSKDQTLAEQTPNTETKFVRKNYYTIETDSSSLEGISNLGVTCKNCGSVKGNPTISITGYSVDGGTSFSDGIPNDDVLKNNKSIILEITGKIDRKSGYDCTDIEYTIDYNAASSTFDYTVYILKSTSSGAQRFYGIIADSNPDGANPEQNVEKKMEFCNINNFCEYYDPKDFDSMTEEEFEDYTEECCTDLEKLCNNNSNVAQQDYCDYYAEYCAACETEISHPAACTDYGEVGSADGKIIEAIDDEDNDNIKVCLLMKKRDEANNSYKKKEYENNPYCQVYCKEQFDYKLPGAVTVNSGTYFKLDAMVSGTKSCYTSKIDTEKFKTDIDVLNSKYSSYSDDYKSELNALVENYNKCIRLDETYDCFDPKIEYEYDETYDDAFTGNNANKELKQYGDIKTKVDEPEYCTGEIDNGYNCLGSKNKGSLSITVKTNSGNKVIKYETADYIKTTIKKEANYSTREVFYTKYPSGTTISKSEFDLLADAEKGNYSVLEGLPISIKTNKGHHKFKLSISNLGEFYDQNGCKNGRLIGDEKSVYNKKNGKFNAEYQCKYTVNCPECDFECEGPLCNIDQCDGKNCVPTCVGNGCAYSEAGLSYAYRTVSLNSLNPSGRKLGYNWDVDKSEKAKETKKEIETAGEDAYETPEYSFTLTPALITAIKQYNKTELENGGYTNETLTCYADKYGNKNVNCESSFIADLVSGTIGSTNNQVTVPASDKKFTSWQESDYCNGTCTITKGSGIGPSWK